jgi:ribose 5-phosphate isomerase B
MKSSMNATDLNLAIDCDEVATDLKKTLVDHLRARGIAVTDLNYLARAQGDYPVIGYALAREVAAQKYDRGILLCGTGLGMAMVANKVEGVWAGSCHDVYSAERLMKSNNANVLTLGSRVIGPELAKMVVDAWLASDFAGGSSAPKVAKLRELEKQSFHST